VAAAVFVVALTLHLVSRREAEPTPGRPSAQAPAPPPLPVAPRPSSDELEKARREAEAEIARLQEQRRESLRRLEQLERELEEKKSPGQPAPRPQEAARLEAEKAKAVEDLARSESARRQAEEKLVRAETPGTVAVVAQLEWVQGDVSVVGPAGKAPARTAKLLVSGQGIEIAGPDGLAVVRFPDQSRLEVGSATVVRSVTDSEIDLVRGSLKADVKRPMAVRTPDAEIRVLGTRFRVDHREATRVDVQEGKVRLSRAKDKASVEVPAGSTVATNVPRMLPRPLRELTFQDGVSPVPAYAGTRDTFLSELNATHPYGANTTLQVDGDNPGGTGKELRMLLRWDLSAVPRGSKVQEAALILQVSMPSEPPYVLHAMKRSWSEPEATWQTSGRDAGTSVLGFALPAGPSEFVFPLNAEGVALVQSWIDAPASNFGFMMTAPKNSSGMKAHARESTEVGKRPRLVVTITPR
jgi:ferric-dicitrate binding protein FerR (iron transport regulator)